MCLTYQGPAHWRILIVIQSPRKIRFAVNSFDANFAHVCHENNNYVVTLQKFVSITTLEFGWEKNDFSVKFYFRGKSG